MRYLVILAVLIAAGCGQKGALYLPTEAPKQQPEATKAVDIKTTEDVNDQ